MICVVCMVVSGYLVNVDLERKRRLVRNLFFVVFREREFGVCMRRGRIELSG